MTSPTTNAANTMPRRNVTNKMIVARLIQKGINPDKVCDRDIEWAYEELRDELNKARVGYHKISESRCGKVYDLLVETLKGQQN